MMIPEFRRVDIFPEFIYEIQPLPETLEECEHFISTLKAEIRALNVWHQELQREDVSESKKGRIYSIKKNRLTKRNQLLLLTFWKEDFLTNTDSEVAIKKKDDIKILNAKIHEASVVAAKQLKTIKQLAATLESLLRNLIDQELEPEHQHQDKRLLRKLDLAQTARTLRTGSADENLEKKVFDFLKKACE